VKEKYKHYALENFVIKGYVNTFKQNFCEKYKEAYLTNYKKIQIGKGKGVRPKLLINKLNLRDNYSLANKVIKKKKNLKLLDKIGLLNSTEDYTEANLGITKVAEQAMIDSKELVLMQEVFIKFLFIKPELIIVAIILCYGPILLLVYFIQKVFTIVFKKK